MSRRFLLLCTALPLLATGCSVVDVKVAKTTPASLRRDAIQATTQSASSPASAALARAQAKNLAEAERAAALLDAHQYTATSRSCLRGDAKRQSQNQSQSRRERAEYFHLVFNPSRRQMFLKNFRSSQKKELPTQAIRRFSPQIFAYFFVCCARSIATLFLAPALDSFFL